MKTLVLGVRSSHTRVEDFKKSLRVNGTVTSIDVNFDASKTDPSLVVGYNFAIPS